MMRAAWLVLALVLATARPASAQDYYREDLRIPMPAAGPRGLEAMLIRPAGKEAYPLALISHGAPSDVKQRPIMSPFGFYSTALEFARRGFAVLVVMRRGYGDSAGSYVERTCCNLQQYGRGTQAMSADLRAAIAAMKGRPDVTTTGMIAIGASAGGLASVALATDPPPGLAAVISFAGGVRWRTAELNIYPGSEDGLVNAFKMFGRKARIPMLWIYAENDSYFAPDLARRMHDAFTAGGGRAQLINAPAFGKDGHFLFSRDGIPVWTTMVDDFLRAQRLGRGDLLPPPAPAELQPHPRLTEKGRAAFANYLKAAPHKAFALSPTKGAYAFWSALRPAEAREKALEGCGKYAPDCMVYAVDDALAATADAAPGSAKQ
jgi:dienelactone hydrolase